MGGQCTSGAPLPLSLPSQNSFLFSVTETAYEVSKQPRNLLARAAKCNPSCAEASAALNSARSAHPFLLIRLNYPHI